MLLTVGIKGLQISAVANNNTAYIINFTAASDSYNDYLPTIEEIINSIKIVDYIPHDSYKRSPSSALGVSLEYPQSWKNSSGNVGFTIYSNNRWKLGISNSSTDFLVTISALLLVMILWKQPLGRLLILLKVT